MQAELQKLELSSEALRGLTEHERYVFALAGHIFNELMLLQKWIHVSRRAPGIPGLQEDASVGVSMFLLRMLAAKTYEALNVLKKQSVSDLLKAEYFGRVDGLVVQWDALIVRHDTLPWLKRVRDKGAFHYMNSTQWAPHLNDAFCEGAYIYVGKRYGDAYFQWSEMGAALPAMIEVNADEPFEGLKQMINDLGSLLGDITDCLSRGLQAYINGAGLFAGLSERIRFDAPVCEPTALHYFFADERLEAR
jgi:hypothetical protein